jgi:thiol:disulfide interchange protein DsbD
MYATFQSENFKNASQPLYVVLSPDEKLLTLPVGYTPNAKTYAGWLRCGLEAGRKK